ncbi:PREDICTED: protein aurora borealis [Dipodomys ordii]|uniref:Protein aurora borealis n=1 Tax=Dipodomys ordii TaxID=10020 RepID=A0A1S3EM88_DIPOR|nr:PREDICTED: protein aurora borealis [Dipodomys ordii]
MGDVKELKMQITPETPGRIPVLNPFESPSDYSNLHEQTLASPSVFKSTKLPTPGEFRWSIDQLAVINPVEIDPEEIHRQASYLSHSRFSLKMSSSHLLGLTMTGSSFQNIIPVNVSININSDSPAGKKLNPHSEKSNAACQTLLSLPVDFNLENILGDYFRADEGADQSPGNLSSSSLRRKLFLDGNGSISDSLPSASPRSPQSNGQASLEVFYAVDLSPVQCRSPMQTPSSGQFSSSPIQGSSKRYSLGSITSPSAISSPTFSPVTLQVGKTPLSEQRKFPFHSPDVSSGRNSSGIANPCIRSPFIDGCSPIKNCSPVRLEMCGSTQQQSSLIHLPFHLETQSKEEVEENKENIPSIISSPVRETTRGWPWSLKSDTSSRSPPALVTAMSMTQSQSSASERELALWEDIESVRESDTVDMADPDPIQTVDESTWIKEPVDNGNSPVTDFMSGIAFSMESSHMCMSPLAESSVLPCEGSSNIQVRYRIIL